MATKYTKNELANWFTSKARTAEGWRRAVLDETMGWGGFFSSGNGGVSVRLNYTLLRKINIDEKVVQQQFYLFRKDVLPIRDQIL